MSTANRGNIIAEAIHVYRSVQVYYMHCQAAKFLACVGMSWRAETSDSQMKVSSRQK